MEGMIPLFFVLAIAAMIGFRFLAGRMDRDRIEAEVSSRGGTVYSIAWTPFGKGWFGSERSRIYTVCYKDSLGNERSATVKTNMWAGVYWTDDMIVRKARVNRPKMLPMEEKVERAPEKKAAAGSISDIKLENEKLRKDNAELRRRLAEAEGKG